MPTFEIRGEVCGNQPMTDTAGTYTITATDTAAQIAAKVKAAADEACEEMADQLERAGCTTKATGYRNAIV